MTDLKYAKMEDELRYYKNKCASLETGYLQYQRENEELKKDIQTVLFALAFAKFDDWKLGKEEFEAIERLGRKTGYVLNLDNMKKEANYNG